MSLDIAVGVLGTAAAIAVAALPKAASILRSIPSPIKPAAAVVTYQDAMLALARVRARLSATGGVSAEAAKAIEAITHDLVEGSEK